MGEGAGLASVTGKGGQTHRQTIDIGCRKIYFFVLGLSYQFDFMGWINIIGKHRRRGSWVGIFLHMRQNTNRVYPPVS